MQAVLEEPARRSSVFGLTFSSLDVDHVVERLFQAATGGPALVLTPNLDHIRLLRRPAFRAAYAMAAMICADGFPLALYARLRGVRIPGRVTGCAIFHRLAREPRLRGERLFFVAESFVSAAVISDWAERRGLAAGVAIAAPKLLLDQQAQQALVADIADFVPSILVLTLGAPVSETFAARHRAVLPSCWVLCIGQAVRIELGLAHPAPRLLRRLGCEWLWRLASEPRRLAPRYARDAVWFPVAVARDIWRPARGEA